jgi:hypothetical protein
MKIENAPAILGKIGIVLLVSALILNIGFDIATKGIFAALLADKIIWLIFGFFLGLGLRGRDKHDGNNR